MEARAELRHARISARKVKIVIDLIRGKNAQEAIAILKYTNKAAAPIVEKLVKSAIANAVNNNGANENDLYISECMVNPGPVYKRIKFASRGNIDRRDKRTSHIIVKVCDEKKGGNK